ncbi:hypothetical protein SDC9_181316 [bioreactor metagenome]|uniref:Uncharacterized protein n=1 Tax=bioreactor metagenome TaxID=1076179 RepID=A0A645HCK5_9ZZZZ
MPLQCVGSVLAGVTPAPVQPRFLQPLVAHFKRDGCRHGALKLWGKPRVLFHRKIQILVRYKWRISHKASGLPDVDWTIAEIGILRVIERAVLVQFQPIRIGPLDQFLDLCPKVVAKGSLISHGVGGQGNVPPIVSDQFLQVADWIKRKRLRRVIPVIRKFRLNQHACFIGGFKELGQFAMRVQPHINKARLACELEMAQMFLP